MARPRKKGSDIPNLYVDARPSGTYFKYRDPRTGKRHSIGKVRALAEKRARSLNAIIYAQLADQKTDNIAAGITSIRFSEWVPEYLSIQSERFEMGEIAIRTLKDRGQRCRKLVKDFDGLPLTMITTRRISDLLDSYRKRGKNRMAASTRTLLIDIFKEAMSKGFFPADKPNPAFVTKAPKVVVQRSRLTLDRLNQIRPHLSAYRHKWALNAVLLALVTGQRVSDIRKMRFSDIVKIDGKSYLEITQEKTKARLRLDIDIRLDAIGLSIRDVISLCRDSVISPYLLHHSRVIARGSPKNMIRLKSITQVFAECRDLVGIEWEGTPASFHELRSLSERLYRKQGIDTMRLLGHKHQSMTDTYSDSRGSEWVTVTREVV